MTDQTYRQIIENIVTGIDSVQKMAKAYDTVNASSDRLSKKLAELNAKSFELVRTQNTVSDTGGKNVKTFEVLSKSGDKYVVTVKDTIKKIGDQIVVHQELDSVLKKQTASQNQLTEAQKRANVQSQRLRQNYAGAFVRGVSDDLTTKPLNQYKLNASETAKVATAQLDLRNAIAQSGLKISEVRQLYSQLINGTLPQLTDAQGKVVKQMVNLGETYRRVGLTGSTTFDKIGKHGVSSARKVHLAWSNFASFFLTHLAYTVFFKFVQSIRTGVQESIELQKRMSEIRTISQNMQIDFDRLGEGLAKVSNELGLNIQDLAEGVYETVSNQLAQAEGAIQFVIRAGQFARATNSSVEDSVNLLSSSLNAFNQNIGLTEYNAQQLFRLIDLGRVRADEIADTLGRVAVIASQTGVGLNEVAAGLSELTIKGIPPSEAMTQLYNVLQATLKPTQAMTKVFNDLGFSTVEQALRVKGLVGFLRELEIAAQGNTTEFAKFFGRIRALRGGLGLTGSSLQRLEKTLSKMTEQAKEYYDEAVKISFESEAVKFEKNWTKIKNFFILEFGPPVLRMLNDLLPRFEKILTLGRNSNFERLTNIAFNNPTIRNAYDEQIEEINKALNTSLNNIEKIFNDKRVSLESGYLSLFAGLKEVADDNIEDTLKKAGDSITILQNQIKESEKLIEDFESLVTRIKSEAQEISKLKFDRGLTKQVPGQSDSDVRVDKSFRERVSIIKSEADKAFRQGLSAIQGGQLDKAEKQIEKALNTFARLPKEKEAIQSRNKQLLDEISNLELELAEKLKTASTYDKNKLNRIYNTRINLLKSEFRINSDVLKDLEDLEEDRIKRFEKLKEAKDKFIESRGATSEKEFIQNIEKDLDNLENDLDKAREKFDELLASVKAFRDTENIKDFDEFIQSLVKTLDSLNQTDSDYFEDFRRSLELSIQSVKDFQLVNENLNKQLASDSKKKTDIQNIFGIAGDAKKNIELYRIESSKIRDTLTRFSAEKQGSPVNELTSLLQRFDSGNYEGAKKLIESVQLAFQVDQYLPIPQMDKKDSDFAIEQLEKLKGALYEYTTALKLSKDSDVEILKILGAENLNLFDTIIGSLVADKSGSIDGSYDKETDFLNNVASVLESAEKLKEKTKDSAVLFFGEDGQLEKVRVMTQNMISLKDSGWTVYGIDGKVESTMKDVKKIQESGWTIFGTDGAIEKSSKALENAVTLYLATKKTEIQTRKDEIINNYSGGRIKYFASGGRGTDMVPAILSPGEFVMNRGATRRFYNQLVTLNAGGSVPTASNQSQNFGDINVSINTKSVDERGARKLAREITNEIKRGVVKWN